MATYTETITLSTQNWDRPTLRVPLETFLSKEEQQLALAIILQLGAILKSYSREKDLFSLNLIMAGSEFMTYVATNIKKPLEEFVQGGADKMSALLSLLQDPENPGLLPNPQLIENTLTLGAKNAEEFRQFAARFDRRQVRVVPHAFAQEVIGWIQMLQSKSKPLHYLAEASFRVVKYAPQTAGDLQSSSELLEYRRYAGYISLVQQTQALQATTEQNRLRLQAKEREVQQLKAANTQLSLANRQMFEKFEGLLELQAESSRAQHTAMGDILESQGKRQDETEALHRQIYGAAIERIGSLEGSLVEAEAQMSAQEQRILSLCAQIDRCYQELRNRGNDSSCCIL